MKTHKFSELEATLSPESKARIKANVEKALKEMELDELRIARGLSQKKLAQKLHVQQPAIAKLEKRADMYISTLRNHIRAIGGELDIVARFPNGDIRISNFSSI